MAPPLATPLCGKPENHGLSYNGQSKLRMDDFDSDPENNPADFDTISIPTDKKLEIGNIFIEDNGLLFLYLPTIS